MSKNLFVAGWIASSIAAVLCAVGLATVLVAHSLPLVLGVAGVEGLCLALLQQAILRRVIRSVALPWVLATVTGALLGRTAEFLVETSQVAYPVSTWPHVVQALIVGAFGFAIGALMAAPQGFALRRALPNAPRWLAVRGGAWALGLVLLYLSFDTLTALGSVPAAVAMAAVATVFAAVAAIVGAIEGFSLAAMLRLGTPPQRVRISASIRHDPLAG